MAGIDWEFSPDSLDLLEQELQSDDDDFDLDLSGFVRREGPRRPLGSLSASVSPELDSDGEDGAKEGQ